MTITSPAVAPEFAPEFADGYSCGTQECAQQRIARDDGIISEAKAIMARRLAGRYAACYAPPMASVRAVRDYLRLELQPDESEVFCVLFLNSQHQLLAFERMFHGTIDGASVYPRDVVKAVIKHNAASVVLAHNHPSGHTSPSNADKKITARLTEALALIDVSVLDHFIIGAGEPYSFAENGDL